MGARRARALIGLEKKWIVAVRLPIRIDDIAGMQHELRIERHHPIGHGY